MDDLCRNSFRDPSIISFRPKIQRTPIRSSRVRRECPHLGHSSAPRAAPHALSHLSVEGFTMSGHGSRCGEGLHQLQLIDGATPRSRFASVVSAPDDVCRAGDDLGLRSPVRAGRWRCPAVVCVVFGRHGHNTSRTASDSVPVPLLPEEFGKVTRSTSPAPNYQPATPRRPDRPAGPAIR